MLWFIVQNSMAWFEGFNSLKGQLTNLAKGVLTEENEGSRNGLSSPSNSSDNGLTSNGTKDANDWNDAFLSSDNLIDPATVPLSSWSNEESQQSNIEENKAISSNKDNSTDIEVASLLPRGLANFFTHHVTSNSAGGEKYERGVQTEGELHVQIRALTEANRRLVQQNAGLTSEVASLSRVVEDLESQVAVSQDENANLSTGLEELDIQHQQAIEQVLVVKDETQKQYEVLQTRYSELESNFEKQLKERLEEKQREKKDSETMYDIELTEVGTECEQNNAGMDNIDFMRELEDRDNELELVVCENARLRELVKEMKQELERQADSLPAIPENSEEVEALEVRVSALENEISILREVRTNLETEVSSSRSTIEDLTRRLQISDAMIRNQDSSQCDEERVAAAVREQCEQELQTVRRHCEKVEASLRSLELQSGDALAKLRREVEDKDRRREELERELEKLQNERSEEHRQYTLNADAENALYKKKISQLQCQLQDMDTQLDKLQKEIAVKDKKMCAMIFDTNSLKEEFDFYKNEMEVNYKTLSEDYENLQVQSNKANVREVDTQSDETDLTTDSTRIIASLENEIKHQQEMHTKTESELRFIIKEQELEIQAIKDSEIKMKEEIGEKTFVCQDLQMQITQLQLQIGNLHTRNNQIQSDYELEKEVLLKELDSLKTISNEFDVSKDIFKQKELEFKNQLQVKEEELAKLKSKMKELEISLEEKFAQIKMSLEDQIIKKDEEIEAIKQREKESKNEADSLIETLQNKLEKLEAELDKVHSSMEQTMEAYTSQKQLSEELQNKYDSLVKVTDTSTSEAENKIVILLEEVNGLKSILKQAELRIKENEENANYNAEMCVSVKEEFMKKLELERLQHKKEIEMINQEKLSLEENIRKQSQEYQDQFKRMQIEISELSRNYQLKLAEIRNSQNEIERLNSVIVAEKSKHEKLLEEKLQEISTEKLASGNLEEKITQMEDMLKNKNKEVSSLSQEVVSLKNQLEYASQLLNVVDRQEAEGQPSADVNLSGSQNQVCPNGCKETQEELNRLTAALLKEQNDNKLLKNQVEDLTEKVTKSSNQLSRLQSHLLSVEENYITELQAAQTKLTEMQAKLVQADDRARNTSTAYTSANIRANQQVESLNQQLRLLTEHKEKLEAELSRAEDSIQRQNAAVTNLQAVLHQFQRDKQKDIDFETERLRQTLSAQCKKNDELLNETKQLQDQLNETKKGLAAANRLSEQLDQKSEIITAYKKQVDELLSKLKTEEDKVKAAYSNVEGKIDRNLMKNLMVGYVCSPNNSKSQVLKVMAQVLDLNKEERQKIGLDSSQFIHQQSLSEAFIRFLESESQPKQQVFLPLNQPSTSAPPSRKTSQSGSLLLTDTIPNLPHFTVGRNTGAILKDVLKDRNT
ncbi:uncharacterized protein isoform X2 [Rhodnius prolixus]